MTFRFPRAAALALALLCLSGLARAEEATRPVLVFAAASLQTALNAVGAAWTAETGKKAAFSYAGSSALARQLEAGAPADIFASADLEWMDWAQERKLIDPATRRELLGNRLVLIAPRDFTGDLAIRPGFPLAQAIGESRLATGQPQVPVGRYARAALTSLGVWEEVQPRIAGVDNVRAALAMAARGEARFAIVYRSDAVAEPRVRVVDVFPQESHPPIVYPFARVTGSTNLDAAVFLEFLQGPRAREIFEREGFSVPVSAPRR